jgi:DNA mismatch repair protein MutL
MMMSVSPTGRAVVLLDPHTINQIAAGEVVERPGSVVKELVENALDAGARRIQIEVEESGTKRIVVRDDGHGMTAEDAQNALLRHATSKIRSVEDLHRVDSLGFRGEAVPSIASVSRFSMSTGTGDGSRIVIRTEGRSPEPIAYESGPQGTTIIVEDLFFNTPARLKFLKTNATEMSAITEAVAKCALAFPDVAFKLTHGRTVVLETVGEGNLLDAISAVWGRDVARALVPIEAIREGLRLRGFVSPPHFTRPTRSQQWAFVNGRAVRHRGLMAAIDSAFRQITPEKRYPVAVLMIDLDPGKVDMNVSPTKSECRFMQDGLIFEAVRSGIKDALLANGMMPTFDSIARANQALAASQVAGYGGLPGAPSAFNGVAESRLLDLPFAGSGTAFGAGGSGGSVSLDGSDVVGENLPDLSSQPEQSELPNTRTSEPAWFPTFADRFLEGLRVIGQTSDAFFILAENHDGLMVIDQHVAHERILFEKIRAARGKGLVEKQSLLTPTTLELEPRQAGLLGEKLSELEDMGFELTAFGPTTFLIRTVPAALKGDDPARFLRDLIDELIDGAGAPGLSARENIWVMCSCKMAIKAGDRLGLAEMEKLLYDLAFTENPFLCPHGRPITITIGKSELLKRFKRA